MRAVQYSEAVLRGGNTPDDDDDDGASAGVHVENRTIVVVSFGSRCIA